MGSDFSKIEAKRLELCAEPFQVRDCVQSAVELLKNRAEAKKLYLKCEVENNVPMTIIADIVRFKQMLINLTNNAISKGDFHQEYNHS